MLNAVLDFRYTYVLFCFFLWQRKHYFYWGWCWADLHIWPRFNWMDDRDSTERSSPQKNMVCGGDLSFRVLWAHSDAVFLFHWNVLTHSLILSAALWILQAWGDFSDSDHISNTSVKGPLYKSSKSIISSGTAKTQPQLICSTSHLCYAADSAILRRGTKYEEEFK